MYIYYICTDHTSTMLGLPSSVLKRFAHDQQLRKVLLCLDALRLEGGLTSTTGATLQQDWCPLYSDASRQPYVPAVAHGPWIGTTGGKVVYDVGGYGMLGWGHNPEWLTSTLAKPQVMANLMTPSLSQRRFADRMKQQSPYAKFVALNSGSEAVSFALRMARVGGGERETFVRMSGAFHGRTDLPAAMSSSSDEAYREAMGGWDAGCPHVATIPYNDVDAVGRTFDALVADGRTIRSAIAEPVQGEGAPGVAMTRPFYDALRERTREAGSALIIDSIQAGIRTNGCLSVVDYEVMDGIVPPDMEVFSKAIHAGQYPLSVVAMGPNVRYPGGIYGNTMTANPRALDVGSAVLGRLNDDLRRRIRESGATFMRALDAVREAHPDVVAGTSGTGLLCALSLRPHVDVMRVERECRLRGLNVIHGGGNALRFTPHFHITEDELEFCVVRVLHDVFTAPEV